VNVDDIANVKKVHAASIFRLGVCRVDVYRILFIK
jgi:hypothetical protein